MSLLPPPGTLALYVTAAVALILTPGPDTVFVLTQGADAGRRAGLFAGLGVATGVLVHTVAATAGIAALLRTSAVAFAALKYAGAAYLVYLGVRTVRGDELGAGGGAGAPVAGGAYRRGLTVNVLNPKVALFFLAFLPGFAGDGGAVRLLLLGGVYAGLTALYLGCVGALAGRTRAALTSPRVADKLRWASGIAVAGLGVAVAIGA